MSLPSSAPRFGPLFQQLPRPQKPAAFISKAFVDRPLGSYLEEQSNGQVRIYRVLNLLSYSFNLQMGAHVVSRQSDKGNLSKLLANFSVKQSFTNEPESRYLLLLYHTVYHSFTISGVSYKLKRVSELERFIYQKMKRQLERVSFFVL